MRSRGSWPSPPCTASAAAAAPPRSCVATASIEFSAAPGSNACTRILRLLTSLKTRGMIASTVAHAGSSCAPGALRTTQPLGSAGDLDQRAKEESLGMGADRCCAGALASRQRAISTIFAASCIKSSSSGMAFIHCRAMAVMSKSGSSFLSHSSSCLRMMMSAAIRCSMPACCTLMMTSVPSDCSRARWTCAMEAEPIGSATTVEKTSSSGRPSSAAIIALTSATGRAGIWSCARPSSRQ